MQWKPAKDYLLSFGFTLKLIGVNWREDHDLIIALQWLTRIEMAESIGSANGSTWMIRRATTGASR